MKKLVSNLLILSLWVFVVICCVVLISPKNTENYLAAAIDKRHLLEASPSPKIILVGGSNVAFSVDGEKIEKQLGLPVINMGLHAGLGLRYMVDEISPYIREGDIVIIIPEYQHFSSAPLDEAVSLDGRPSELGPVIKLCPQCFSTIHTLTQTGNVVVGILPTIDADLLQVFRGKYPQTSSGTISVYSRAGFDHLGNFVAHLTWPLPGKLNGRFTQISIATPNPAIKFLNSSQKQMEKLNARIFFMFPAIPETEFNATQKDLLTLEDLLQTELDIPILGGVQDFVFPEDFFFDSVYHLNRIGREQRTNLMIDLLRAGLQQ